MQWHQLGNMQTTCTSFQTSTPHHSIFTGRMFFLTPNQQCKSTEGINGIFSKVKEMQYSGLQLASLLWELTSHMGSQCHLPPGRGDIPAFTPAKLVIDLVTLEGCKAELT